MRSLRALLVLRVLSRSKTPGPCPSDVDAEPFVHLSKLCLPSAFRESREGCLWGSTNSSTLNLASGEDSLSHPPRYEHWWPLSVLGNYCPKPCGSFTSYREDFRHHLLVIQDASSLSASDLPYLHTYHPLTPQSRLASPLPPGPLLDIHGILAGPDCLLIALDGHWIKSTASSGRPSAVDSLKHHATCPRGIPRPGES